MLVMRSHRTKGRDNSATLLATSAVTFVAVFLATLLGLPCLLLRRVPRKQWTRLVPFRALLQGFAVHCRREPSAVVVLVGYAYGRTEGHERQ
eukprot:scaffold31622_cov85-Phaeocystis_antarctica.AAC.3